VPPFLVAAVLNAIVAQRLARRIHMACVESYTPSKDLLAGLEKEIQKMGVAGERIKLPHTFYRGKGCDACNHTGYYGRIGIFEVLEITEDIRKLIISPDFSLDNLNKLARNEGMTTMLEDGLQKVELGLTTIEELFRVIKE
jgi:type II secretory ATPase GspE/PulE/Tfp pilus assembly ATPase PilB-like protein